MGSTAKWGERLRAMRLGYRWSAPHQAYVRISDVGSDRFLIDVRPEGTVGECAAVGNRDFHRRWWDEPGVLEALPALDNVAAPRRPLSILVDDEGERIDG